MIGRSGDVPLSGDPASRYLPWTVALLVFLATLAFAAGMLLASVGDTWRQSLSGTLTVQVPASDAAGREERVNAAIELLRSTPGVQDVRAVPDAEISTLLEPWLGKQALDLDLPMPDLIDVTTAPGAEIDLAALSERLTQVAPGTVVDDHAVWLRRLTQFAGIAEIVAFAIMLIILCSAAATVVFTTQTGLAIHRDVVELLHLIGAQDSYVARQFQIHTLRLAAAGAAVGFAMSAGIIWMIQIYGSRLTGGLLPELSLGPLQWALLAGLAIAAVLLVVMTAGITVRRVLGKMI